MLSCWWNDSAIDEEAVRERLGWEEESSSRESLCVLASLRMATSHAAAVLPRMQRKMRI